MAHAHFHDHVRQVIGQIDLLDRTQRHRLVLDLRLLSGEAIGGLEADRDHRAAIGDQFDHEVANEQHRGQRQQPDPRKAHVAT
jgi:hypothetical protein